MQQSNTIRASDKVKLGLDAIAIDDILIVAPLITIDLII